MLPNFLLTRVYGLENLAGDEGARIYAFNHNNSIEVMMVPVLIIYHLGGRMISFVIDWMYGKVPVLGSLMDMTDPVYVYHKRSSLRWIEAKRMTRPLNDTVERCSDKLRSGKSIGIFPEGKRNRNPENLLKGKPGIGHITLNTGTTVVPVGIDFECRTKKKRIPVLGRTIVRIGKPLNFRHQSDHYLALLADTSCESNNNAELNQMAADVTHEIMLSLAELSGKQYSESCHAMRTRILEKTIKPKEHLCQV
jgi:1-acyl-sn-glycerol-3-phosphate acyltransferase